MTDEHPAETEVSASSGPIKITLRAHRTKLKAGESLWLQIEFSNLSSAPLMVRNEDYESLRMSVGRDYGLSIRVEDDKGKDATPLLDGLAEGHAPLNCMGPEDRARWEKALQSSAAGTGAADSPVVWLKAGESVASPSQAYQSGNDRYCGHVPTPKAIRPFSEFAQARTLPAGSYLLRVTYDVSPRSKRKRDPEDVKFSLPPLAFEVAR